MKRESSRDRSRLLSRMGGAALLLSSCTHSAQEPVELVLEVQGSSQVELEWESGARLSLTRADLVFGPLTLCPGAQAGALCDTARLEWRDASVIDALSDEVQKVGILSGNTGAVRSWMYDHGIVSLLTSEKPLALPATEELDGASVILEGEVVSGSLLVPFSARLVLQTEEGNERGVPLVRMSAQSSFRHEVTIEDEALRVRFQPAVWIRDLPEELFLEEGACAPGLSVVCAGSVEQRCDASGQLEESRDCLDSGEVCAPGQGCKSRIELEPGSSGYRILSRALIVGERPSFSFR